jgi:hypothetical protein
MREEEDSLLSHSCDITGLMMDWASEWGVVGQWTLIGQLFCGIFKAFVDATTAMLRVGVEYRVR